MDGMRDSLVQPGDVEAPAPQALAVQGQQPQHNGASPSSMTPTSPAEVQVMQINEVIGLLKDKKVLHVKGFGGGEQIASDESNANLKQAVSALEDFAPDYLVVDGDPWNEEGFGRYIKSFVTKTKEVEKRPKVIWVRATRLQGNDFEDRADKEKRRLQAIEWSEQGIPIVFTWIDEELQKQKMNLLFGANTSSTLEGKKFNDRGSVLVLGQPQQAWVSDLDGPIRQAIQRVEDSNPQGGFEKCSFENAAKGNAIFDCVGDAECRAQGVACFGGGESVLLELASFYLNPRADNFNASESALIMPFGRGRETDPLLPRHVGIAFDVKSGLLWARPGGHNKWMRKHNEDFAIFRQFCDCLDHICRNGEPTSGYNSATDFPRSDFKNQCTALGDQYLFAKRGERIGQDGRKKLELLSVSADENEVDGFPGASVIFAVGAVRWRASLQGWLLSSGLRLASIIAVVQLDVKLFKGQEEWHDLSYRLRYGFVSMSVAALLLEVLVAVDKVKTADMSSLEPLLNVRGINECCTGTFRFIAGLLASLVLRFLAMPAELLSAPINIMWQSINKQPLGFEQPPVLMDISRINHEYQRCSGQLIALPKMLLEDLFMFVLKIALYASHGGGDMHFVLAMAILSFLWSFCTSARYLRTVFDYEAEFGAHLRHGDPLSVKGRYESLEKQTLWRGQIGKLTRCLKNNHCIRRCLRCRLTKDGEPMR